MMTPTAKSGQGDRVAAVAAAAKMARTLLAHGGECLADLMRADLPL